MSSLIEAMPNEQLAYIAEKLIHQQRLSHDEGVLLLETEHDEAVRLLADYERKRKVGDIVYFASTLFIHPTNLCELSCRMCSFYAKPGWEKAWFLTPETIEAQIKQYHPKGLTEIHIVGGLWRECNLDYYQNLFTRIKNIDQNLHIKALTPVEYDFLAKLHGLTIEEVFQRMIGWGLGSLPGGGAEILVEEIRKKLAPGKITSDEYLSIHRIAHQMGLRSNISMLFGHIESSEHIATHLCRVRELQDETGMIQTFVPLKYHVENNTLGRKLKPANEARTRRVYAVSRLMLDNVRNIKALWNYLGIQEGQKALEYGANCYASTAFEEKIIVMAGGVKVKMTKELIMQLITEVGRIPLEIHSGHDYTKDYTPENNLITSASL
ncbi:MAG: hypothetical protein K0S74_960 [Chlamydiales bacterium]|jgi:CofH subfamily radical SAM domain protein|nr:hypothetical protein [Chlamydiales bacterium]